MNKVKEIFSHDKHHSSGASDSSASSLGNTAESTPRTSVESSKVNEVAPPPSEGHSLPQKLTHLDKSDAEHAEHTHQHLAPVTQQDHHKHIQEEVQRERTINRHIHHVQHHNQVLLDSQHSQEKHHEKVVPTTHVREEHVNTDADRNLLAAQQTAKDSYNEQTHHNVVDKGETVHTNQIHHVSHVVQPIIKRDTHDHEVVHTRVPIVHTTHEAPIVHQSVDHEPMPLKDFIKGGGSIDSKHTIESAGALKTDGDNCARTTEGPLESLKEKLHLGPSKHDAPSTTTA